MNPNKDYYSILGVLPTAEDAIVRRAYKALAQYYKNDRNSLESAKERLQEINEAYGVLSDSAKRRAYDEARGDSPASDYETYQAEEEEIGDSFLNDIAAQWAMAVEYFPGAEGERRKLAKISKRLAFSFQLALLENQKFSPASVRLLATTMRDEFIATYCGAGREMRDFALRLIELGRRDALLELNKAVKVLGAGKNERKQTLDRIAEKFNLVVADQPPTTGSVVVKADKKWIGGSGSTLVAGLTFGLLGIVSLILVLASLAD